MGYNANPKKQDSFQDKKENEPLNELKKKIKEYELSGLSRLPGDELINIAQKLGQHLKTTGLKTTQIRRFLDGIRRLDMQFNKGKGNKEKGFLPDQVMLLKPKLAYAAGRNREVEPLMDIVEPAITAGSKSYDDFKKLLSLMEAIVAYHKYYGGAD